MWKRLLSRPVALVRVLLLAAAVIEVLVIVAGPDATEARAEVAAAVAAAKQPPWEALADQGIWLAAFTNLVILILLAVAAPFWLRPMVTTLDSDESPPHRSWWKKLWIPAAVLVFAFWYGSASFASKSLWWDELWSIRQVTHGQWKEAKDDPAELVFSDPSWKRTFFYYAKPTNHPTMSVAQRLSLDTWRWVTGAPEAEFSDLAARMPALLASGIAVVLLFRLIGLAHGVAWLAVLLALHPWHLRYGVEARAYAFIVPLCLSALLASRRVITTRGRDWKAWVWLAVNQGVWVWTFMLAAIDVGILFLITGYLLWKRETHSRDRVTVLVRHVIAHVFAMMLWVQAFLPNFLQVPHWNEPNHVPQLLNAGLARQTLSQLFFGMEWQQDQPSAVESQGLTSLIEQVGGSSAGGTAAILVASLLMLLGLRSALRRTPVTGLLLIAPLLSAIAFVILGKVLHLMFYPRFIIALLPVVIAGWALVPPILNDYVQKQRWIALVLAAAFIWLTAYQRQVLRTLPYAPFRDVAEYLEQRAIESGSQPVVICFGLGREALPLYYPRAIGTDDLTTMRELVNAAKNENKECLLVVGYPFFHSVKLPEAMDYLRNPDHFEEVKGWPAIEPDFYFRVYRAVKDG
jgi:hypothetical protein